MVCQLKKKSAERNKIEKLSIKNKLQYKISYRKSFMKRNLNISKFLRQPLGPIRLPRRKEVRTNNKSSKNLTQLEQIKLELSKLITISQEKFREKWNFDPIEMTPVTLGDANNNTHVKYQWELVA